MFQPFSIRMLGIVFVVVVLFCAGIYFYTEWSNKRFVSELGEPPRSTMSSEPGTEIESNELSTSLAEPTEFVNENSNTDAIMSEPEPVDVSKLMNEHAPVEETETAEPASEFDPTPLLSAFGLPEEVTSLLDEEVEKEEFEVAETHLIDTYGQSPEVEAVIDKLKQMSGGPVELSDLTELFEAWIRVLPEEEQGTRRQLMNVLTQLNQIGMTEGNASVGIEVRVIDGNAFGD